MCRIFVSSLFPGCIGKIRLQDTPVLGCHIVNKAPGDLQCLSQIIDLEDTPMCQEGYNFFVTYIGTPVYNTRKTDRSGDIMHFNIRSRTPFMHFLYTQAACRHRLSTRRKNATDVFRISPSGLVWIYQRLSLLNNLVSCLSLQITAWMIGSIQALSRYASPQSWKHVREVYLFCDRQPLLDWLHSLFIYYPPRLLEAPMIQGDRHGLTQRLPAQKLDTA